MTLIQLARKFKFIREVAGNHGLRVNAIQKWCGGADGDSWCCFLVTMILDLFFEGNSPVPRGGSCQVVYQQAIDRGWIKEIPLPGDLFFYVDETGHAHHIGFVPEIMPLTGLAGNTSEDGLSSNGTGVFEKPLKAPNGSRLVYARIPGV